MARSSAWYFAGSPLLLLAIIIGVDRVSAGPAVTDAVLVQARAMANDRALVLSPSLAFDAGEPFEGFSDAQRSREFWVEKKTGKVRRYSNRDAYPFSAKDIGEAAIAAAADQEFSNAYATKRSMKRTVSRKEGGDELSYQVDYREFVGDVATFNYASMIFSPDGTLASCMVQDYDVQVGTSPSLSMAEAVRIVADKAGMQQRSSQQADLVIRRFADGSQRLCWRVQLRTGDESYGMGVEGLIDAQDGKVLDWAATGSAG